MNHTICDLPPAPAPRHPVHAGKLSPSAKNCKGCAALQWEDLPAYPHFNLPASRRRICTEVTPPRIPGNIRCPLICITFSSEE